MVVVVVVVRTVVPARLAVELVIRVRESARRTPPAVTTTEDEGTEAPGAEMAFEARGLLLKVHLLRLLLLLHLFFLKEMRVLATSVLHELSRATEKLVIIM